LSTSLRADGEALHHQIEISRGAGVPVCKAIAKQAFSLPDDADFCSLPYDDPALRIRRPRWVPERSSAYLMAILEQTFPRIETRLGGQFAYLNRQFPGLSYEELNEKIRIELWPHAKKLYESGEVSIESAVLDSDTSDMGMFALRIPMLRPKDPHKATEDWSPLRCESGPESRPKTVSLLLSHFPFAEDAPNEQPFFVELKDVFFFDGKEYFVSNAAVYLETSTLQSFAAGTGNYVSVCEFKDAWGSQR